MKSNSHACSRSIKRRARPTAVLAALLMLGTSACSGPTEPAADAEVKPQKGGHLTYALDSAPDNLDPNSSSSAVNAQVIRQVFDSLVWQPPEGEIQPWLAKSWDISDDGQKYTFQLRKDVTFHDGTKFNAKAVCFNFDRITDPETQSRSAISALGEYYESCEATGKYEVTATLSRRDVTWLSGLSQAWTGFQSPAAVKKYGKDITTHPVGTGPFMFESMALNSKVVLKRNPEYDWAPKGMKHQGTAYLNKLTFQTITEPTTRFRSVGNDVQAAEGIATQDVAAAKENPDLGVDIVPVPGTPYQLFFNQTQEPWDNPEARRAARSAMNIPAIIKSLYFGVYDRAWSPLTPATKYYEESLEGSIAYDPQAAKAAFEQLGWKKKADGYRHKNGEVLTIRYLVPADKREKRQQVAQFLQENLKEVGVRVKLQFLASGPYSATRNQNEYDVMGLSLTSGFSALSAIYDSENYPAPGKGNYYNYAQVDSPKLDKWLAAAQNATSEGEAAELYSKIQQYVIEEAVSVPVYNYNYTVAHANTVHGLAYNWKSYPLFYDTYLSAG